MTPGLKLRLVPVSIRWRLLAALGGSTIVLFSLMLVVDLFGLPFGLYAGRYKQHEVMAMRQIEARADSNKLYLSRWFGERLADLNLAVNDPLFTDSVQVIAAPDRYNRQRIDRAVGRLVARFGLLQKNYGYGSLELINPATGRLLFTAEQGVIDAPNPIEKQLFADGDDWDEKLFFSATDSENSTLVNFAHMLPPATNGGTPAVAVILSMPIAKTLGPLLHQTMTLGQTGETVLLDLNKTILAPLKYPLADDSLAQPLHYQLRAKPAVYAANGVEGVMFADDYRGVPVVAAIRHLRLTPDFGLGMVVKQDRAEIMAPIGESLAYSLITMLCGLLSLCALLYLAVRWQLKPLERLSNIANLIESGDLSVRSAYVGKNEIGQLSTAINNMAERVQNWHTALGETVDRRTDELLQLNAQLTSEICERQLIETSLRESNDLNTSLLRALPFPMDIVDAEGNILFVSELMDQGLGRPATGERCWSLYKDDQQQCTDCPLKQPIQIGSTAFIESAGIMGGRTYDIFHTGLIFQGKPALLELFLDVTERKRGEEERQALQEQLAQTRKIESVGRLAGGVAHDFNNMLGVILGHAEIALLKMDATLPQHQHLVEIRKAAERSAALTRQLLAFARKQTIAPQVLDLNETIAGMLNMLRRLIGEDLDLAWLPGNGLPPLKADPSQLDQILANLCLNARDAISDGGKVTIETANIHFDDAYCARHTGFIPGEYLMLAVSDNGCGMTPQIQAQIFEPFFTTKAMGQGTGLGLATVYGIVKQNNGFINVYSEPGLGTTFRLYLPRYQGEAGPQPAHISPTALVCGDETILLVEDQPELLAMGQEMLGTLGYRVLAAGTADAAIELAKEHANEIDLLLTDVVMPGMNGLVLARHLQSFCPGLKLLFMSGYTANVIAHNGILDEGVHFLQKPFSIGVLADKVRETLQSD